MRENRSKLMLLIILISCYQYNWTKWKYFYLLFFTLLLGYTSEEYLFIFLSFSLPRRDNCVHKWFWIADRHEITLVLDPSHYFLSFVTLYGGDRFAMVPMNKERQKKDKLKKSNTFKINELIGIKKQYHAQTNILKFQMKYALQMVKRNIYLIQCVAHPKYIRISARSE